MTTPPYDYPGTWDEWWAEDVLDRLYYAARREEDPYFKGWYGWIAAKKLEYRQHQEEHADL